MHIKKRYGHVEFRIRLKKYDVLGKKSFLNFFSFFFQRGEGPFGNNTENMIFQNFSKFSNYFLKNGLNGTYKMLKETNS